ncbi:MAG: hypothetical protein OQL19_06645 [Gammaproteobacteria bacterium]|nr:hypothetical protein [Gammaproteobacteria bacterium]
MNIKYIIDIQGEQNSDSIEQNSDVIDLAGKDRSSRPYLNIVPTADFLFEKSIVKKTCNVWIKKSGKNSIFHLKCPN